SVCSSSSHSTCPIFPYTTLVRSHVGELRRFVARRVHRLLQPRNRVVLPPQLDEIAPDVVVGIPERGIHRDRALAFGDRGGSHVRSEEHTSELQSRFDLV